METAPLFTDIAGLPEGGKAYWRMCPDDVRVRVAVWNQGGSETVLICPGRTEYIEKYGPTVQEFMNRGYSVSVVDWRGQGIADRHPNRPQMGHVGKFSDYQQDLAEMLATVAEAGLPSPTVMVAHSMGGAIGLRALLNGLAVEKAIFSAPMWGIYVQPHLRALARVVSKTGPQLGFGNRYIPSGDEQNYVEKQEFAGNTLTNDAPTYKWIQDQIAKHPELGLGSPSCHWYSLAVKECADIRANAPSPHDCICFLGTEETIVSSDAIEDVMARWPNGRLVTIENSQHEVLLEEPHVLKLVWSEIDRFLEN
ncbi:MAG: alpha/beta hydrolase [Rhodobacteraceae bacterium]|nr:alpha/beta hydrolase [Paracoccaceae bacterium]